MSYEDGAVAQTLTSLGIDVIDDQGNELQAHCPAHQQRTGRADRNPSWYINVDSGKHICFSCGFKGSLEYLVSVVRGSDLQAAEEFISARDIVLDVASIRARLDRALARNVLPDRPRALPESRLAMFTPPPLWALHERRIHREACEEYGVLWDTTRSCWITPLRTPDTHGLLGWQEKGQRNRHFRNQPPTMRKSSTFFGWPQVMDCDRVILVESPLDAVRLASVGQRGGIAVCGSTLSAEQMHLLSGNEVIVAFDNPKLDLAGRKAALALFRASARLHIESRFFSYADTPAKDVGEMSSYEIKRGLRDAQHYIRGVKAIYS